MHRNRLFGLLSCFRNNDYEQANYATPKRITISYKSRLEMNDIKFYTVMILF